MYGTQTGRGSASVGLTTHVHLWAWQLVSSPTHLNVERLKADPHR